MFEFMSIAKALSDENRVRILLALNGRGELCVCHLIDMLELAPSTVSNHLLILRNARLVRARKQGRWIHYRLSTDGATPAVTAALQWVVGAVAGDPVARRDEARLGDILAEGADAKCGA